MTDLQTTRRVRSLLSATPASPTGLAIAAELRGQNNYDLSKGDYSYHHGATPGAFGRSCLKTANAAPDTAYPAPPSPRAGISCWSPVVRPMPFAQSTFSPGLSIPATYVPTAFPLCRRR